MLTEEDLEYLIEEENEDTADEDQDEDEEFIDESLITAVSDDGKRGTIISIVDGVISETEFYDIH